ncbi:MAG: hypothetical protein CVU88_03525 [Firmicutes bacterium HGW-Firmicutes-13]|nr:MAG: hypothetical protein CVU88_03525 [Firmicutes bacterium HGW-Firmicutes-13]
MNKKLFNQFICSRMMLPEHREKLNEHHEEIERKENYRLPSFDEQQWDEFEFILSRSLEHGLKIEITVLTEEGYLKTRGVVKKVNPLSGQISISIKEEIKKLPVKDMMAVKEACI